MTNIPEIIFIVPYRDRKIQKNFFLKHMRETVLIDNAPESYKIMFVHQMDNRSFNRGAMKNIGFLAIKQTYPKDYKTITLVFNDIDTMPHLKDMFPYKTTIGTIKHFYGFKYALGGIVSITGEDFERLNGFPNYWAWGYEDNDLQRRCEKHNIHIDRSIFYPIFHRDIIHLQDGTNRIINAKEKKRYDSKINEGLSTLSNVKFEWNREDDTMVEVNHFDTYFAENTAFTKVYDLKKGNQPYKKKREGSLGLVMSRVGF